MHALKLKWSKAMESNFVIRLCVRYNVVLLTASSAAWYIAETRTKQNNDDSNNEEEGNDDNDDKEVIVPIDPFNLINQHEEEENKPQLVWIW